MGAIAVQFVNDYFKTALAKEFFYAMCGECLGDGVSRTVFEYLPDKSCVVKLEHATRSFQNVMEWDLWQQHSAGKGTSTLKWLAPCVSISESGNVLVQKRTKPVPWTWKLPKLAPNVLCADMKRENWGIYRRRLVCHDYGRHDAIFYASKGKNMDVAPWLEAQNGKFKPRFGAEGATGLVI